jgi:hypothetical protein
VRGAAAVQDRLRAREVEGADELDQAEELALFVVLREPVEPERLKRELTSLIAAKLNPLFRVAEVVPVEALCGRHRTRS